MESSFNLMQGSWVCTDILKPTEIAKLSILAQFAGLRAHYLMGYTWDNEEDRRWLYVGCHGDGVLDMWTESLIETDRKTHKLISLKELRIAIEAEINKSNK